MFCDTAAMMLAQKQTGNQAHQVLRRIYRSQVQVQGTKGMESGISGLRSNGNRFHFHRPSLQPDLQGTGIIGNIQTVLPGIRSGKYSAGLFFRKQKPGNDLPGRW